MRIKAILWTYHVTKSKEYPIKIRVTSTSAGKTNIEYFPINVLVSKNEWDQKAGRVKIDARINAAEINLRINTMCSEIERNYLKGGTAQPGEKESFYWWFKQRLDYSEKKHGTYNLKKLKTVYNKLRDFAPTLLVSQLNYEFLKRFETYLLKKGNHPNNIADNMHRIKIVVREILKAGYIEYHKNPFLSFQISYKKTNKERLAFEDVEKLLRLTGPNRLVNLSPSVQMAIKMYGYSFYNGGIRFGDLCRQKWEMIVDGRLRYVMHKSNVEKNIKLHPWVIKMLSEIKRRGPYIFDVGIDWNDEDISISKKNSFYNRKLKEGCEAAGIPKITFHTARHSIADLAVKKGVTTTALKDILGHTKIATTEIYMRSFYSQESDKAMEQMFKKKKKN